MSFFDNIPFFLVLAASMIPAIILGLTGHRAKYYILFLSVVFIALIYGSDKKQLLFLTCFYVFQLALVKLYLFLRLRYGRKSAIYLPFLFLSIAPLAAYKILDLFTCNLFGFLGISYLTFKTVQIIIESYDGVIKEIPLFDFTCFLLFFPTLSSGPIDRSRRFSDDLACTRTRSEYVELLGTGLKKIVVGAAYKFAFSAFFYNYVTRFAGRYHPQHIIAYTYSYGLYLFFDFAGYSLMAVGVSYLLGIRTPDNFKYPFISTDLKDFWNRWHITLSHWFRDFIFSRFMMNALRKKWFKSRLFGACLGLILNMTIMGFWHGITTYYIAYGLYHGILLAITEVYQKKSKFHARHKNGKVYKTVTWFVTLNLVMFGFLIFSGHLNDIVHVVIAAVNA